jgi:two-component system, NtrC family, sensor kinase
VQDVSSSLSLSAPVDARELEGMLQSGRLAVAGELAAGAAHEINNPLFAIITLTGFLLREAEPGSRAEERLTLIEQSANEIKDVVERLHHFLRQRSDWGVVSLDAAAHEAAELVRHTSTARRKEIVEHYPDEPVLVEGSAAELTQAFVNLLTNAMQAAPEDTSVTVRVWRDRAWAVATVSDEGEGIPLEQVTRVFETFYTTKNGSGTGLGLPVSRAIAELHGGSLEADPGVEQGARLVLRLPLAESG